MEPRLHRLETDFGHLSRDMGRVEADVGHVKETLKRMSERLEEIDERQQRDFRMLFGAVITVALGLGSLMAKGFGWLG